MMEALNITPLKQSTLPLKLTHVSVRELFFLPEAPCDLYSDKDGLFKLALPEGTVINLSVIKSIVEQRITKLFVLNSERHKMVILLQDELKKVSRGLSIGDPITNGKKIVNLLSLNMSEIYAHPTDDEALTLQIQSMRTLGAFLADDIHVSAKLYKEYMSQKYHYVYSQPLISTLLLSSFLGYANFLSDKECDALLLTSYFKDIGMATIASDKFGKELLSDLEKKEIQGHTEQSIRLLRGRLPVGPNYFEVIRHHHTYGILSDDISEDTDLLWGIETILVMTLDIVAAMTSHRPYRAPLPLYNSLDYVRKIIGDQYPQEFKLLVQFFKKFMTSA